MGKALKITAPLSLFTIFSCVTQNLNKTHTNHNGNLIAECLTAIKLNHKRTINGGDFSEVTWLTACVVDAWTPNTPKSWRPDWACQARVHTQEGRDSG